MRARPRAEDLEDQPGTIDDFRVPGFLEIALLDGCQLVIDDDETDPLLFYSRAQAFHGAFAEQRRRRHATHRDGLCKAHVEVNGACEANHFLELCATAALLARHSRPMGTQHCRDGSGSCRLVRRSLASVVTVKLSFVCQISIRL